LCTAHAALKGRSSKVAHAIGALRKMRKLAPYQGGASGAQVLAQNEKSSFLTVMHVFVGPSSR